MPPSRSLVVLPSCPLVLFSLCRTLVASSHRLVVVLALVVPPSHPLVAPPHSRPIIVLSLVHRTLVALSHRLVDASPLVVPPSRFLVAPPHSCPIVILSLRCSLVALSRRLVVASPLVAPPSRFLVAPPHSRHSSYCCPLTAPPSCCLIALSGPALVASAVAYWRTTTDHRLLPPLATCNRLGPKVGLLLGLSVRQERCGVRCAAWQDVVGLAASHALHSSGSNVHGVVCNKQRILVSSIGCLFQLSKILRQD